MNIEAIARKSPQARPLAVPAWTLGCFHRRCITYANGREDAATQVVWIQSHGLTGDIRVPAWRPRAEGRSQLSEFPPSALPLLASVEGGVADTRWDDGLMAWSNWAAFQPYDKWPEPGLLHRVGACLIETAPSGAYVEDWRLQPGSGGLLVGLRLMSEAGEDGVERPRDGGLVISGQHALFTLDRRQPLPSGAPAQQQVASAPDDAALLGLVFQSCTHYALRGADGRYRVTLSTDPFGTGQVLPLDGFSSAGEGLLRQALAGDAVASRLWRIDTLLPQVEVGPRTEAAAEGREWLEREAGVLLRA